MIIYIYIYIYNLLQFTTRQWVSVDINFTGTQLTVTTTIDTGSVSLAS